MTAYRSKSRAILIVLALSVATFFATRVLADYRDAWAAEYGEPHPALMALPETQRHQFMDLARCYFEATALLKRMDSAMFLRMIGWLGVPVYVGPNEDEYSHDMQWVKGYVAGVEDSHISALADHWHEKCSGFVRHEFDFYKTTPAYEQHQAKIRKRKEKLNVER